MPSFRKAGIADCLYSQRRIYLVSRLMTISDNTQKMMRLLSQVILADGHIYKTEMDALIQGIADLELSSDAGQLLTPDYITQWFNTYLEELNTTWSKTPKDVELTRLILSLAEWPDKQSVVDALEKISLADNEFHAKEKTLISIVKTYWQYDGLDAPGSKIEIEP